MFEPIEGTFLPKAREYEQLPMDTSPANAINRLRFSSLIINRSSVIGNELRIAYIVHEGNFRLQSGVDCAHLEEVQFMNDGRDSSNLSH